MKLKYLVLCFLLILSSCFAHSQLDRDSIRKIVENTYNARLDSLLLLSEEDNNQSYIAVNLVDDSTNLSWWEYGFQTKDSILFFSFNDFVKVVIEQCDNDDHSLSIINKAMVEQDFQWQCTSIDSITFCSLYSRHALALVTSTRKLQFFHSENLVTDDYESTSTLVMDEIIEAWQKATYGFSASHELFRLKDPAHTGSCMYLIRSEHQGKYAYAILLDLDKKYVFSLEDIFGHYTENSMSSYSKETFSKFLSIILSSSIPNSQKLRCISSIVNFANLFEGRTVSESLS